MTKDDERQQLVNGAELARKFYPENGNRRGFSEDMLKALATDTRRTIHQMGERGEIDGAIISDKGRFRVEGEAAELMDSVGGVVAGILENPEDVKFPELKHEISALPRVLIENRVHNLGRQPIIAPVCPDYGRGDKFYQTIGNGISPEAEGAMRASRVLSRELTEHGFQPDIVILVANTEVDIPEIMDNVVEGEVLLYQSQCEASAGQIRGELEGENGIRVATFTEYLGDTFQQRQYECEDMIREVMIRDEEYRNRIFSVAEQRYQRHAQILGRPEEAHELTVRYAAQYMALGSIVRDTEPSAILLNYPTPNRSYFNATRNVHPDLQYTQDDRVLPVIGSVVNR